MNQQELLCSETSNIMKQRGFKEKEAVNSVQKPKLSICILTVNRATLLDVTLGGIVRQANSECEILVLDSASNDNTEDVVKRHALNFSGLRYVRKEILGTMDEDRDEAISLSRGEYCWLFSSKDLMGENAISTVLSNLSESIGAVIVNMEIWNHEMSVKLVDSALSLSGNRLYRPCESDLLFNESYYASSHFSCTIVRRDIWQSVDKTGFYDSQYTNLLVLFKQPMPLNCLVLTKPLVLHRFGQPSWGQNATRLMLSWNPLIDSLALSEKTKSSFKWSRSTRMVNILHSRAQGWYALNHYRSIARPLIASRWERFAWLLITAMPKTLINTCLLLHYKGANSHYANLNVESLRRSPYHISKFRWRLPSTHRLNRA